MPFSQTEFAITVRGARCLASVLDLSRALDANTGWLHIAVTGRWEGHPTGPFALTRDDFATMVANFARSSTPLKIDYEHDSLNGEPGPKPAAGRITKLETRADGAELWGLVEWTPRAAEMIRAGEYARCSPVIRFDATDRVTGEPIGAELLQVGLTDDPFLDGLKAIQLTRSAMEDEPKDKDECDVAAAATEPATDGTAVDVDAGALLDMIAEASGIDRASALAALADKLDELVEIVRKTVKQDGTPAERSNAASAPADDKTRTASRLAAIQIKRATDEVFALRAKVSALESAAAATAKAAADAAADAAAKHITDHIERLVLDGFIRPDEQSRSDAAFAFGANWETASRIYAHKIAPIGESQAGPEPRSNAVDAGGAVDLSTLTTEERALVSMLTAARCSTKTIAAKLRQTRSGGN